MVHLILRQTPLGERAFPIEQSEINKMLEAGTIKRMPEGIYKEIEPEAPVKRKYTRKDLRAEGDDE